MKDTSPPPPPSPRRDLSGTGGCSWRSRCASMYCVGPSLWSSAGTTATRVVLVGHELDQVLVDCLAFVAVAFRTPHQWWLHAQARAHVHGCQQARTHTHHANTQTHKRAHAHAQARKRAHMRTRARVHMKIKRLTATDGSTTPRRCAGLVVLHGIAVEAHPVDPDLPCLAATALPVVRRGRWGWRWRVVGYAPRSVADLVVLVQSAIKAELVFDCWVVVRDPHTLLPCTRIHPHASHLQGRAGCLPMVVCRVLRASAPHSARTCPAQRQRQITADAR